MLTGPDRAEIREAMNIYHISSDKNGDAVVRRVENMDPDSGGGINVVVRRPALRSFRGNPSESDCAARGRRGFTFIEILIAMLIGCILAAIAIPSYFRYLERKKEMTAITDITAIANRLTAYAMESPLPPDLATVSSGIPLRLVDPWGNPYRYLPLSGYPSNLNDARKDHNLHPINTLFDLYSMGPDGETNKALQNPKSRDDIVRANDGAFVGKASVYDP